MYFSFFLENEIALACNMGVLVMESLERVKSGLAKTPAKEVAIKVITIPTCRGRIPASFH